MSTAVRTLFNSKDGSALEKGKELYGCRAAYDIELPAFSKIQESLHIYFENVGRHYPAIQRENTRSRVHETIEGLTYASCGGIYIDYVAAPTVALLCIIIAIAEMIENNTLSFDTRATHFAKHARSLLQTFEDRPANLEVLRCHTLITIYLLHMECLDLALQSIAVTVRLAMALQLHRRSSSPKEGGDSYDQYLWWTIYVLDRDLACLGGIPYLIRDEEIDAPRPARDGQFKRFSSVTYINCSNEVIERSGWMEESVHQEDMYLETLAHLGRLWARIWDDLATDSSELDCQWQAMETLDAQFRILRQQLPAELVWMSPSGLSINVERAHEIAMERQLIILMRINTLRLFMRRNPASKCTCLDRKSPYDDGTAISAQTIKAIVDFSTHNQGLSPIGHFISTTLVQCILYLIKTIGESSNTSETESASTSVVSAYQALVDLSKGCVSARSAVKTLDEALFRHDGPARPQNATIPQPYVENSRHPGEAEGALAKRPHRRRKKSETPASPEESHRGNDLFECLQKSYESLDSLLPSTMPTI
ncbi:uncharacterized protein N7500_009889 [Penicillium coprophilum]|uniref:uncharacterized protein n=1 Tax=Penicillium coprophilum TaxID=36646 RepID=UPI0023A10ABE|nr:uncharacterized protein N7500_009889 [Penicillium coprophilum]KAJ5154450.1 hypothetical protein N7500_009889 [Penicillium coprophilum]